MNRSIVTAAWIATLLLCSLQSWAQEDHNDPVKSVEVNVVEAYKAQVKKASKITSQPSFKDSTTQKLPVKVSISPTPMILEFSPKPIPPIVLKGVRLPKLPTQSVTIGGGNYGTSLVNLTMSSPRSKRNVWGISVDHYGVQGGLPTAYAKAPQYYNSAVVDYQRATRTYNFKTLFKGASDRNTYYGIMDSTAVMDTMPALWNNNLRLEQHWTRLTNPTSKVPLIYRSGMVYGDVSLLSNNSFEWSAGTQQVLEVPVEGHRMAVPLNYSFIANTPADGNAITYHNVGLAPLVKGEKDIFNYRFGLNMMSTVSSDAANGKFKMFVYPTAVVQVELLKRVLAVYGGWDGYAEQNTMKSILAQNPYVYTNMPLKISGSNKIFAGMQGTLGGSLQYRVEGSLNLLTNALQFERDSSNAMMQVYGKSLPMLTVGYLNTTLTKVRGELNLPKKYFTATAYAELTASSQDYVALEGRVLGGQLKIDWKDLHLVSNLKYVSGRYKGPGYELADYMDLSIGLRYELNSNLNIQIKGSNLLNQQADIWSGYAMRGTRGIFALQYQF